MDERPLAYGVDFGTSNSLISVAWPDRVDVVDVGSRRVRENLPSVVYLNADGNRATGDEAVEQFLVSAGVNSRLLVGIKSDLSDARLLGTSSWGRSWTLSELVAIILRSLKRAADTWTGAAVDRVVLGHPVAFVGTEGAEYDTLQSLAMERLIEAAQLAGFSEVETLEEPAAAIEEEEPPSGVMVSLDFGAGTFDVAVVDYRSDDPEVIGLQGAAIGGEQFDQLLFNAKIAGEIGLLDDYIAPDGSRHRLPGWVTGNSRSMLDLRGLLSDTYLPAILTRFRGYGNGERLERFERLVYGGFSFHFYEAIEEAKIRLSVEDRTVIEFHRRGFDMSVPITRAEFNKLIEHHVVVLEKTIRRALDDADVSPNSVERVVKTGGSSAIPIFAQMVESIFRPDIIQQRPPFTTVVRGLGCYAQEVWR